MMKKQPLFLLSSFLLLASCGEPQSSLSHEAENTPEASSVVASPAAESAVTSETPKDPTVADLKEDLSNFVPFYMGKLESFSSYRSETHGSTKAKVWFVETTQTIDVLSIKGDYSYLKNESHGSVDSVHEAYFHGQKTLVKNLGEDKFAEKTMGEYLDAYGVNPHGHSIEGYSLTGAAINSLIRAEGEGNLFEMTFDPEKATNNVRIQMKAFGGLDDYPVFSSIKITLKIQDDFTPITYEVKASYKAKKWGVESDCHQEYTVTFSAFNASPEVPNLEAIRSEYNF
ncbi:MAG: hypothetical protein E7182_00035 [Erysipelotrichaceae bacterium]|nr:hypothetical protein [Erysipelotrichaceae bacterium]